MCYYSIIILIFIHEKTRKEYYANTSFLELLSVFTGVTIIRHISTSLMVSMNVVSVCLTVLWMARLPQRSLPR